MTYAMVDIYCASYPRPPAAVTLDIDNTIDVVHGQQQLALFNAHYDTVASRPVAVLLRPGKTSSGGEVRSHPRRLVRRIRRHWPLTRLTIRGDGHLWPLEVMTWCEANPYALRPDPARRGNLRSAPHTWGGPPPPLSGHAALRLEFGMVPIVWV